MLKSFFFLLFFGSCLAVFAQGRSVLGVVRDMAGDPIVGASIVTSDKRLGTSSDIMGYFRIQVPEKIRYLEVSCIGYAPRRVVASDSLYVILRARSELLDESLVVAYETTQRSRFTGAVSVLDGERFHDRAIGVVTHSLEGVLPGVQVGESDGQPGSSSSLRIRGFGSVNAGCNPVYVVDGSIYNGELCDLNPFDIQSVTVLKDAASAALYGSSAGNGVVLIRLNKGLTGRSALHFNMKQGFSERGIPEYDRVGISDYYRLEWEMLRNGLISGGESAENASGQASLRLFEKLNSNPFDGVGNAEMVLPDGNLNPAARGLLYDDLDWASYLFRRGYRGEYNLSYRFGQPKSKFYVSLGYLDENGYVVNSGLKRMNARLSADFQPISRLKVGVDLNVSRTEGDLANTHDNASSLVNPFYFTRYIGPAYPIHRYDAEQKKYITDAFGKRVYDYSERGASASFNNRNIVEETKRNRNHFERNGFLGRGYCELTLLEGLTATVRLGIDSYDQCREQYELKGVASSPGRLSSYTTRGTSVTATELVTYQRSRRSHELALLLGHESYAFQYQVLSGVRQDQVLDDIYEMSNFLTISRLSSYTDTYRKEGYFLRVGYNYGRRYELSLSYRRDGSSRFSAGHRWGNFWSVGGSWNVGRELFLSGVPQLDYLKLRISYGHTGNDAVLRPTILPNTFNADYYPSQSLYTLGVNNALEPGIAFSGFGNPALKWETQASLDVAMEFSWAGKLSGVVEYFRKDSRDLLFDVPQVLSSGTTSLWMNTGKVRNSGVELSLNGTLIHRGKWDWKLGMNATFLHNKITSMPQSQPEIADATRKLRVGSPLYNFWLKEYRGVNPETGDAQYTFDGARYKWNSKVCYVDAAGDSLTYYSNYAKYHDAGNPIPRVYGGLTTNLGFQGWELSGVVGYSLGGKTYNTGYSVLMYNGKYGQAFHRDILRRWQKPGDRTDVPRLDDAVANKRLGSIQSAAQANAVSDRWLMSASYLSLKSVTLSYRLPESLLRRWGVTMARIYISGENLALWSAMKGFDPRQLFKGVVSVSHTPARTFCAGITLTI